jgi:hypothetical protein
MDERTQELQFALLFGLLVEEEEQLTVLVLKEQGDLVVADMLLLLV